MTISVHHDPIAAAFELREQLASAKRRLGFFMGAGTSIAVGFPGIEELTEKTETVLPEPMKSQFKNVKLSLVGTPNVEDVLNNVRLYRELLSASISTERDGLSKQAAVALDAAICSAIANIVRGDPPKGMNPHTILAHWLQTLHGNRDYPVEIFTTNYDLLIERSMEEVGLPFFDGFVGAVAPFFAPESVEADTEKRNDSVYPPKSWTRVWKLHGSIGWHVRKNAGKARIARLTNSEPSAGEELMIFPSREKYVDSRKLPFITYQDRLRKFLTSGESMLLILGYRFSDEHLNEIIFQGLRSNSRLAVTALVFGESTSQSTGQLVLPDRIAVHGTAHRNLSIYGPDKGVIGGVIGTWSEPSKKPKDGEQWPFWDDKQKSFTLGDFEALATYLERFIGFRRAESETTTAAASTAAN